MTWQPIDSAPKDGTPILGYDCGEIIPLYWDMGLWQLAIQNHYCNTAWEPTHWQPLPDPPEAQ